MSRSIYKVNFVCNNDCEQYGGCGAKCSIVILSNNSQCTTSIYYTDGHEDKNTTDILEPKYLSTNHIKYLKEALNMTDSNHETLTENEFNVILKR